ncbi:unnamed protein product [Arabis nemorensis]|uniref:Uncharacterized protein n=1 Tax=Arabis nemorensis TaxID=586526 RepID=A0A565BE14_9BRAS|nr:unnamed protein product [Arabis nemorensis]
MGEPKENQVADILIKKLIEEWLKMRHPPQNTMLITGDNGFYKMLDLFTKSGHKTLLVYQKKKTVVENDSINIREYVDVFWNDWRGFLFLRPAKSSSERKAERKKKMIKACREARKVKQRNKTLREKKIEKEQRKKEKRFLEDYGKVEVEVAGDGNCQFRGQVVGRPRFSLLRMTNFSMKIWHKTWFHKDSEEADSDGGVWEQARKYAATSQVIPTYEELYLD